MLTTCQSESRQSYSIGNSQVSVKGISMWVLGGYFDDFGVVELDFFQNSTALNSLHFSLSSAYGTKHKWAELVGWSLGGSCLSGYVWFYYSSWTIGEKLIQL